MKRWIAGVAAAVCVGVGAVWAQNAPEAIGPQEAAVLAAACFNCHGPEGVGQGPIPAIAGMPAEQLVAMLNAFKANEVPGATIMGRLARGYDDAEIAAIAAYFAGDFE
ncbi:MAG: c-type cytochrome [Bauldia sp.]|nr:c-type cytochrome [Bauldia sp.]